MLEVGSQRAGVQCPVFTVTDTAILELSTHCLLNRNYGMCCPGQMTVPSTEGTADGKIPLSSIKLSLSALSLGLQHLAYELVTNQQLMSAAIHSCQ